MEAPQRRFGLFRPKAKPVKKGIFESGELVGRTASAIRKGADEISVRILDNYSWIGDAAIKVLTDAGYPEGRFSSGAFGSVFKLTYEGKDYVMKMSVEAKNLDGSPIAPFPIREGLIGAYLVAPYAPSDEQQYIAVPEYRRRYIKETSAPRSRAGGATPRAHFDPFLHAVDTYGALVMTLADATSAFEALDAQRTEERGESATVRTIVDHISETIRLTRPKVAPTDAVVFQIFEYFPQGNLGDWTVKMSGPTRTFAAPFPVNEWITDPRTAGVRLDFLTHHLTVAFYQGVLTINGLGALGVGHGDAHEGNVFVKYIRRADAVFIYRRGVKRELFKGRFPFKGPDGEELIPVFAIGDFGMSAIGTMGRPRIGDARKASDIAFLPHPVHDIHYLALGIFRGIVRSDLVPKMKSLRGDVARLKGEPLIAKLSTLSLAYYRLAKTCKMLSKFWIPIAMRAPKAIRPGIPEGAMFNPASKVFIDPHWKAYEEYVKRINALLERWDDWGKDWLGTFQDTETVKALKRSSKDLERAKAKWTDEARAGEENDLLAFLETRSNVMAAFAVRFDTRVTNWDVVQVFDMEQKKQFNFINVALPKGVTQIPPMDLEETARRYGLAKPNFVQGTREFWETMPAAAKAAGRSAGDDEEEDVSYEELF
jgi:hypothetical protein